MLADGRPANAFSVASPTDFPSDRGCHEGLQGVPASRATWSTSPSPSSWASRLTTSCKPMVKDIITPLISAAGGRADFGTLQLTVGSTTVRYGLFLNAVIAFLIIATVIYFLLVAPMGKLVASAQRKREAAEKECPECLSVIPAKATRCKSARRSCRRASPAALPRRHDDLARTTRR